MEARLVGKGNSLDQMVFNTATRPKSGLSEVYRNSRRSPVPRVLAVEGQAAPESCRSLDGKSSLEHLCRALGSNVKSYRVTGLNELQKMMKFIGSIVSLPEFRGDPIFFHISLDGNSDGMRLGQHSAPWEDLTQLISEMFRDLESFSEPMVFVLWAQGASESKMMRMLVQQDVSSNHCIKHMFLCVDSFPTHRDRVLAWTHFYVKLMGVDFEALSAR